MNAEKFQTFIDRAIEQNPIEAKILRKIIRALKANGTPITMVFDGEEENAVKTERDIFEQVFNLDECYLNVGPAWNPTGWVRFIMGNEWDCISDYTLGLESALKPVNDYIERNW